MSIWLTVQFTNGGIPATGLTPSLSGWRVDTNALVTSGNMTHVSNGLYKYEFSAYDDSIDYIFQADGGATLADMDRYQFGNNEIGQVTSQADSISAAHTTELAIIAGLVQRNQRITDTVYDANKNLITATLKIYSSAADAYDQVNEITQFRLDAVYNPDGTMSDYMVREMILS